MTRANQLAWRATLPAGAPGGSPVSQWSYRPGLWPFAPENAEAQQIKPCPAAVSVRFLTH